MKQQLAGPILPYQFQETSYNMMSLQQTTTSNAKNNIK
jgi:hypothetical protein